MRIYTYEYVLKSNQAIFFSFLISTFRLSDNSAASFNYQTRSLERDSVYLSKCVDKLREINQIRIYLDVSFPSLVTIGTQVLCGTIRIIPHYREKNHRYMNTPLASLIRSAPPTVARFYKSKP